MVRNIFYAIVIIYGIVSCAETTDDSKLPCTKDCTVLQGYFITTNDAPVNNVKLRLIHRISRSPGGAIVRVVRDAQTNERGYFNMNFFVLDSELGDTARESFELEIDLSGIDKMK